MRVDRFDPGPQPAGRLPAPGRLGLVQAFLNTFWDLDAHGGERWPDPAAYGAWLAERGFATARVDGSWRRLKACPHERCGWAFYDRSRNQSSQWCSMRICGNRTKGARHR